MLSKISLIRKRANSKHITYFSSLLLEKLSSPIALTQANNAKKYRFTSSSPLLEKNTLANNLATSERRKYL